MRIENNFLTETFLKVKDTLIKEIVNLQSFNRMSAGDKFKAQIVDIRHGEISIKLSSGETMTAKSLVSPDAKIGDSSVFIVRDFGKGRIFLEMEKNEVNNGKTGLIKAALYSAGLLDTDENVKLVLKLIDSNIEINTENLLKAIFFRYFKKDMDNPKAIFLMKEEFSKSESSVKTLLNLLSKDKSLYNLLEKIVYKLEEFDFESSIIDFDQKAILKDLVKILEKSYIDLKNNDFEKFKSYYKNLLHIEEHIEKTLKLVSEKDLNSEQEALHKSVIEDLELFKENLLFLNQISKYKNYMQIPFCYNDGTQTYKNQGELFVFNNYKGKEKGEILTALVALDTNYIGRIEAFIVKNKNRLNVQFFAQDDSTVKLIKEKSHELSVKMMSFGVVVTSFKVKKAEENFTIINDLGLSEEQKNRELKRFSFDMRV